jgi:hypothetical protein
MRPLSVFLLAPSGTNHHVSVIDCATQQTLPDPWPIDVYVQHVTAYPEQQRPRGVLPPPPPGSLARLLAAEQRGHCADFPVLNVISLEVTGSKIERSVTTPSFVRQVGEAPCF